MDRLQQLVLADTALSQSLLEITDRREFIVKLAAVARLHGLALEAVDIDRALTAARRKTLETWV